MPHTLPPRVPDWPERLAAYIEQRRHRPFAWGHNDCGSFVGGALHALTGAPMGAVLPGVWGNDFEAARLVRDAGSIDVLASRVLGEPITGPGAMHAPRGSVVCVDVSGRQTLGIAAGNDHWCAPGADGLVFRPMAEVRMAWSV